jgi:MFS family permease
MNAAHQRPVWFATMTNNGATSPGIQLPALVLLTALSTLPTTIIAPALPNIAVNLGASPAVISWAVAGYAAASAVVQLISGALTDRHGGRPVAVNAVVVFIVATLGCALANNLAVFLICRAIQAVVASCFAVALVSIKRASSTGDGASRLGYAAMAWALAPMIAPALGGALEQFYGWRSIFAFLVVSGSASLYLALWSLPDHNRSLAPTSQPHLHAWLELMRSARFWAYALCMTFSMGTFFTFMVGAPLAVGGSGAMLGLYMGGVPAGFVIGSFLTGRYARLFERGTVLMIARGLTCFGLLLGLGVVALSVSHPLALFAPCAFIGVGNGLTMPSANMGVMSVKHELAGTAAGLAAAMSTGGGALVLAAAGLFLSDDRERLFLTLLSVAVAAFLFAAWAAFLERRPLTR